MSSAAPDRVSWSTIVPVAALALLVPVWGRHLPVALAVVVAVVLIGAVLAAVYHAEVVAHRVGEPFGSLVLAVAVTIIEVALIVTLMISGGDDTSTLARDTVFAAVMITLNGIVGLSLVVGAVKHHLAVFNAEGAGSALATVIALAGVAIVLPRFTADTGPTFSSSQLAFAAVASLVLYGMFVFTQTVRHRDFFLPVATGERGPLTTTRTVTPTRRRTARRGPAWSSWSGRWSRSSGSPRSAPRRSRAGSRRSDSPMPSWVS